MPIFDQGSLKLLAQQQLDKMSVSTKSASSAPQNRTLTPLEAVLVGAALDGASTYNFLKKGTGREGNAAFQGLSPATTGILGASIAPLTHLVLSRKWPKLANMISSQVGARQLALGAENIASSPPDMSSDQIVTQKLNTALGR